MRDFAIRFLTREGCLLCLESQHLVEEEGRRRGLDVVQVDIDQDVTLRGRYGSRVPVVLGPGDRVLAEGRIARRQLRRALRGLG